MTVYIFQRTAQSLQMRCLRRTPGSSLSLSLSSLMQMIETTQQGCGGRCSCQLTMSGQSKSSLTSSNLGPCDFSFPPPFRNPRYWSISLALNPVIGQSRWLWTQWLFNLIGFELSDWSISLDLNPVIGQSRWLWTQWLVNLIGLEPSDWSISLASNPVIGRSLWLWTQWLVNLVGFEPSDWSISLASNPMIGQSHWLRTQWLDNLIGIQPSDWSISLASNPVIGRSRWLW